MSPQKLVQCTDEVGNKLKGFKWDSASTIVYHSRKMDRKDMRFSVGIKSDSHVLDAAAFKKIERKAHTLISERLKSEDRKKTQRVLCGDVIDEIIKRYETLKPSGDRKNHTLSTVKTSYSKIKEYWGAEYVDEITAANWDKFQDWFDEKYPGYNSFNVTKYFRVLRNACMEKGLLRLKPTIRDRNIKALKQKRKAKKDWVYNDDEIIALDKACRDDFERLVIRCGYQLAFRISEALSMEWSKINLETKTYHWSGDDNKAGFSNVTPLSDDVCELLEKIQRKGKWVTPQVNNEDKPFNPQTFDFHGIRKWAGVSRGTFHSLRHYRLSCDFKDTRFTAAQVCLIRRITLATAHTAYIHTSEQDLELMRNSGSLKSLTKEVL